MKRILIILLSALVCAFANAYNFEGSIPADFKVRGKGSLALDTDRYKDGKSSLRFSWTGQAELLVVSPKEISAFMDSRKGGIMFWLCNEVKSEEPLRFFFRSADGKDICWFDFGMNFTGWRAGWVRYEDMKTAEGYVGDIKFEDRLKNGAYLAIRPSAKIVSGSFCIDRMSFTSDEIHHQNTPDFQIPDNNHFISRRTIWHWARLYEWEQYPRLSPSAKADNESLARMKENLENYFLDEMPSGRDYKPVGYRKTLQADFESMNLKRLPDGTVAGIPIVSNDEHKSSDMLMQKAFTIMYRSALDYRISGNKQALEQFFLVADHLIWQGVDFGSGMGTNHHYGYNIRGWADALWLLRNEIREAGKMEKYLHALEYWSGLAECRVPYEENRDEIIDSWNTLLLPKLTAAMLQATPEMRQAQMEALTKWMSASMSYSNGTLGGVKVDGTAFHHGGHYPAYAEGAFTTLGTYFRLIRGTDFIPSKEARLCVKNGLHSMRTYCNLYSWGIGISGRHPFGGRIPEKVRKTYGYLAVLGNLTQTSNKFDPELGGDFLALSGDDKTIVSELKKDGIKPSSAPVGFFVYNYGAFGILRRNGWMVTLKGYNSDVWGSEIYAKDNRYGRYQSYGSVQIINSGSPASAEDSRYVENGWDWNRLPGTTTIHLPFDLLNSPYPGTLMERNTSRFPGVSSLEGQNGVLAFTFSEKNRPNFSAGATATKSVFCFDNRMVFIGTGITNDSSYPTETTLFQQVLNNQNEAILADGELVNGFPQTWRKNDTGLTLLEDLKGNCYILKDASDLVVYRQHQTSPNDKGTKMGEGDFVSAVLDHGSSPKEAHYEYLVLVEPSSSERNRYSRKLPYEVVSADNNAHVVKDIPSGIVGYVSYKGYKTEGITIPAETIVMQKALKDGIRMSICTPDLGISDKAYTTPEKSQAVERKVILKGHFSVEEYYTPSIFETSVTTEISGGNTIITAKCKNGQPVEFKLKQ